MLHELGEAEASSGIRNARPNKIRDAHAVLFACGVGLWECGPFVVLHVACKVFKNVVLQQGKDFRMSKQDLSGKVVLVTGAARRIGAAIVTRLHEYGAHVAIHYRASADEAESLANALNGKRKDSAATFQADLLDLQQLPRLISAVTKWAGRLDCLVNNASSFYPTPVGSISEEHWKDLMGSNLKAPLFLSQAAVPELRSNAGVIINIVDIHAQRPLRNHAVYGPAKAGLAMLTRSLAKDLAPHIRVNGVSPGAILWPEDGMSDAAQQTILRQVPLQRPGEPDDIAGCVLYLWRDATYVTGQIIAVDGGRSIGW
jgi:pteridine reductase